MALLIGVLLSATSQLEFKLKWTIVAAFIVAAAFVLTRYFSSEEKSAFFTETWSLTKKIFPLLVVGTFITGMIGYFMPTELLRTDLGIEQLPGVLYSLYYRRFALYADLAGGSNSRDAVRLQHRNNCSRPGAFSAPGRAFSEPTKHDSDHESHWPKERWCLHHPGRDSLHFRGYALRSDCLMMAEGDASISFASLECSAESGLDV